MEIQRFFHICRLRYTQIQRVFRHFFLQKGDTIKTKLASILLNRLVVRKALKDSQARPSPFKHMAHLFIRTVACSVLSLCLKIISYLVLQMF